MKIEIQKYFIYNKLFLSGKTFAKTLNKISKEKTNITFIKLLLEIEKIE